jgi:protein-arginine kinase activator protein McsA
MDDDLALVYMWAYKQAEKKYKGRIEELEEMLEELLEAEEFDTIEFAKVKDKACKVLGVENVWR